MVSASDLKTIRHGGLIGTMFGVFSQFHYPLAVRYVKYSDYPGDEYHHHDFPQVWYCLSGKYTHIVDDTVYECEGGSMIIVPPGSFHNYAVEPGNTTELICLEGTYFFFSEFAEPHRTDIITNIFCHHFSEELGFPREYFIEFHSEEREELERLLIALSKEDYKRKISDFGSVKSKIGKLFSLPTFSLTEEQHRNAKAFISNKLTPMMNSIEYMNKNYSKKIHREELIKISTLCQTDYFKLIKKIVGSTYSIYLQMIRLRRAQTMITFSTFSFTYIADKCGFGNRTYMGKLFKKYYGKTMSEDRDGRDEHIAAYPHMIMTHEFWDK